MIFTHKRQKKFIHHSPIRLVYDTVCQYQKVLFQSCAKQLDFFGTSLACSPKISGFLVTAGFLVEEMTLMKNRKSTQIWMCLSQLQKQHILRRCLTCSVNYILMWKTILFSPTKEMLTTRRQRFYVAKFSPKSHEEGIQF